MSGVAKVVLGCGATDRRIWRDHGPDSPGKMVDVECEEIVEVQLHDAEGDCYGHYEFDVPEGWFVEVDAYNNDDPIVRCPKHRRIV